jgi:hypothetical protein
MERTQILETAVRLSRTIDQLTEVLEAESGSVYAHSTEKMTGFYRDKTSLLADYAASVSALREAGKGGAVDLPAELSAEIKTKSARLAEAMERNMKALSVAGEASRRVVEVIIEAVRQQRQSGAGYGVDKDGGLVEADGNAEAVTLDTKV